MNRFQDKFWRLHLVELFTQSYSVKLQAGDSFSSLTVFWAHVSHGCLSSCLCLFWYVQVERKRLEKEMGNLGLDMDDKDDVSSDLKSAPRGCM